MTDYLYLGPVPANEECIQVNNNCDYEAMKKECVRYKQLILNKFGQPPEGASIVIKTEHHDLGMYYEVCVKYDDRNEQAIEWAYNVENNAPGNWE